MRHLLSAWPEIALPFGCAHRVLLFSDFDGTLAPIVAEPGLANLADDTRHLLQALKRRIRFTLGIVSGRALADLKKRVGISGISYAGNHGLEIEGPGLSYINPVAVETKSVVYNLGSFLSHALKDIKGVIVEDKGLTLSVHYRQVSASEVSHVDSLFKQTLSAFHHSDQLRIISGKKTYEVWPDTDWNKGSALTLLIAKYGSGDTIPVYLGDDATDEYGFRAVNKHPRGLSVFVGENERNSQASYFLKSPLQVSQFLQHLVEHV